MKFTSEDILQRLLAGEKVDDIAAELTSALNEANSKYKKTAKKRQAAENVLNTIDDFLHIYYPELCPSEKEDLSVDTLLETLDNVSKMVEEFSPLVEMKMNKKNDTNKSDWDKIAEWLEKLGLE